MILQSKADLLTQLPSQALPDSHQILNSDQTTEHLLQTASPTNLTASIIDPNHIKRPMNAFMVCKSVTRNSFKIYLATSTFSKPTFQNRQSFRNF